jgi:hypothetical protein
LERDSAAAGARPSYAVTEINQLPVAIRRKLAQEIAMSDADQGPMIKLIQAPSK